MTLESDRRTGTAAITAADLARRDQFVDGATDIPSQRPVDPLPVAEAGVCEQPVAFTMPSFAGSTATLTVSGAVTASAALPASRRGVHMSRIVSSIDSVSDVHHGSLASFLRALVLNVADAQELGVADVAFTGTTVVHRTTPVTGLLSPDRFGVFGRASLRDGKPTVRVGLRASVMTACPCTQVFTWYTTVISLADRFGVDMANDVAPYVVGHTHSQRGNLEIEIESDHPAGLEWAFSAMAEGAHLTQDLLKRPDEHALVQRAHNQPQFTEDVVRAVASRLLFDSTALLRSDSEIRVSCRNLESIHAHDVQAVVRGRVVDLGEMLVASRS